MANNQRRYEVKRQVLIRDGSICQKCGASEYGMEVHHILPLVYGGKDYVGNCITLCHECHKYVPDDPMKFINYVRIPLRINHHSFPTHLRMFNYYLKLNKVPYDKIPVQYSFDLGSEKITFDKFFLKDFTEEYINRTIKILNFNYEKCFSYRHKKDIFTKYDMNDLFDLAEVTNFIFGEESIKEITKQEKLIIWNGLDKDQRIMAIQNYIKYSNDKITYRKIAKEFGIHHTTIKKYMTNIV